MKKKIGVLLVWVGLVVLFAVAYSALSGPSARRVSVDQVFERTSDGEVESVTLNGDRLVARLKSGESVSADIGRYNRSELQSIFGNYDLPLVTSDSRPGPWAFISDGLPFFVVLFLVLFAFFYWRRMRSQGGGNIWLLRRSTAKLIKTPPPVTFADVGGNEEAKLRLGDVVGFLREPMRWQSTGARPPRGVLLEGAPGLGKTLLARALAGEAKVPIFTASGSEFVELFVGVGAARVRDLFETARKQAPCIVFIDELDAVARKRGSASSSLIHQEREQALNQLLVAMDGFAALERVIVVAATNRSDVLDPALLRPGRFDLRLKMAELSQSDRLAVLKLHTRNKALDAGVNLEEVAARCPGLTGAELEHLANEAALAAVRAGRNSLGAGDFQAALDARQQTKLDFDQLDVVLAESSGQLSVPARPILLTAVLREGGQLKGTLLWADAQALKLKTSEGPVVVSRAALARLIPDPDTESALREELQPRAVEIGAA